MLTPLLSIHDVSKTYGGSPALIDAALDLLPGEVHALMGENGAGKSTLIKILAGVVTPDRASIQVNGRSVTIRSAAESFAHGLRFIHQELNVVPQLSVAENIFLSQRYPRRVGVLVDWSRLNTAARDVLAGLNIDHIDPRVKIARLNTGDQMLVKIAAAFVGSTAEGTSESQSSSIYVMDEPTAALTQEEAARLFAVIERLKGRGCAILYVSHRLDEIFRIADRMTVMRDGRVIATKPISETDSADLVRLMTGRDLTGVYPPRDSAISEDCLLQVRNLATAHLYGATFDLHAGEIIGVAGLTGSGRSELLRALVGADRCTGGEAILMAVSDASQRRPYTIHRRPDKLTLSAAWKRGIAYVPEERRTQGLILSRSIRDNVTLPHLHIMSRAGIFLNTRREENHASQMGDSVRLKSRHTRQAAHQLSGGNQQKVLFARALAGDARVLLLDEPTRGVDVGAKYDIYLLLRELSAKGVGVVMASSDLAELIGMCDRIIVLRGRRQAMILETGGLTQDALLAACYGEI